MMITKSQDGKETMTAITVNITREMINRAGSGCDDCPIALGLAPHLKGPPFVRPDYVNVKNERGHAVLPGVAREFVRRFDTCKDRSGIEPFSFTIEVPYFWVKR